MHSLEDPELRKKFTGQPEHLINFLFMVAEDTDVTAMHRHGLLSLVSLVVIGSTLQEAREIMASLGIKKFNDLIGRTDLLRLVGKAWEEVCTDFEKSHYAFGLQSFRISLTASLKQFLLLAGLVPVSLLLQPLTSTAFPTLTDSYYQSSSLVSDEMLQSGRQRCSLVMLISQSSVLRVIRGTYSGLDRLVLALWHLADSVVFHSQIPSSLTSLDVCLAQGSLSRCGRL